MEPQIITYLITSRHFFGKYPELEEVLERFSITKKQFMTMLPKIQDKLAMRGQPHFEKPPPQLSLDPLFVLAVDLLSDTVSKKSRKAKLDEAGISPLKFKNFLRDPDHLNYYKSKIQEEFQGVDELAKISLAKNVEAGDLQSIKYFHELTNIYRPDQMANANLMYVISRMMEVLVKYVKPTDLEIIAMEIEALIPKGELSTPL